MAQCPWIKNGCCRRQGMLMVSGLQNPQVCLGKQVNNQRYTDCQYYINPKTIYTGRTPSCPLCERGTDPGGYYVSYCHSNKQPGGYRKITDTDQVAYCYGKMYKGKKYTSCPCYYRGGSSSAREGNQRATKQKQATQNAKSILSKVVWGIVLLWFTVQILSRTL